MPTQSIKVFKFQGSWHVITTDDWMRCRDTDTVKHFFAQTVKKVTQYGLPGVLG